MSRFFASVADSDSSSSEEDAPETNRRQATYSSDEEDVKRVVKPLKEKYYDEIRSTIQLLNNYAKINDYASLLTGFDNLIKSFDKVKNSLDTKDLAPPFLIRSLYNYQQFIASNWENTEVRKTLSKTGYKSLTSFRQKVRKFNKYFQDEINDLVLRNENDEEDDEEEHLKDDSSEEATQKKFDSESPDSSQWDSDSECDSDAETPLENLREKFLKKTSATADDEDIRKRKTRLEKRRTREPQRKPDPGEEGGWETVKGGSSVPLNNKISLNNITTVTVASVNAKLREIVISRTLKRTERRQRIQLINELIGMAVSHQLTVAMIVKLKIAKICGLFDYNISALEPMKPEHWEMAVECLQDLAETLAECECLIISSDIEDDEEELETPPYRLHGSVAALMERTVNEFIKGLKQFDPFKAEYPEHLKEEKKITAVIDSVLVFLERQELVSETCRVKLCKIEHFYYKYDSTVFDHNPDKTSSVDLMDKLCKYVYVNDSTQRLRTRAILCQIYHLALHDFWLRARDLMLMSHLQSTIHHADPRTQILYNRAMAQLGLCAFRLGQTNDAHNCLSDLITTGRVREMLGQGFTAFRTLERTHEQEQRERQYQVPFHMYIHLELLECVYLVSAMLVGIPALACQESDARRRLISKAFYQLLRNSERQSLVGPPETMREHIVAASRALKSAKWRECRDFIFNTKMDSKIWRLLPQPAVMKKTIVQSIQKQALKTFIFSYASAVYNSIHIPMLSEVFEMTTAEVVSTLSAMIVDGELDGAFHLPSETLLLTKDSMRTPLQILGCQLAEKLGYLLDSTERCCLDRSFRQAGQQIRTGRQVSPYL